MIASKRKTLQKYERTERRPLALEILFRSFVSLPFDDDAARHYAAIRHDLETCGEIVGPNDLMIAAICRAHGLILVTGNVGEFDRVRGLRVEHWSQP